MSIDTVFLVEDHTESREGLRYWTSVYTSPEYARSAVNRVAQRAGIGALSWNEGSFGVLIAYPQADAQADRIYTVVPLGIRQRDETDTD